MAGKRSRDKGNRIEREIVNLHKDLGFQAERVPLSGAAGGSYKGDMVVENLRAEVKARANGEGFKTIEGWLGENQLLFLRKNNAKPMIVMPWETYIMLMEARKLLNEEVAHQQQLIEEEQPAFFKIPRKEPK